MASDANFTQNVQKIEQKEVKAGDVTYTVTTPTEECYYRLTIDMPSNTANGSNQISKLIYYYDDSKTSTKKDASVSFATPSYSFTLGSDEAKTFTGQTATTAPAGLALTYSLETSDNDFATIEESTGTVVLDETKAGKATVTASFAGNDEYKKASVSYTIEVKDPNQPRWVKTELSALTSTDQFVIADLTSKKAMSNDNGTTKSPSAVDVTISDDGTELTGNVADNLIWNVSASDGSYTFYPNGTTETWLYFTNSNSGVRVGTGDAKTFTAYSEGNYSGLKGSDGTNTRYLHEYNNADWRCYKSATQTSTSIAYFKCYAAGEKVKTSTTLKFADGDKSFYQGDTDGLTFTNAATLTPAIAGAAIAYTSSDENIAMVDANGQVTVSTANEGKATITASFAGNDDYAPSSASYTVSVEKVYENIAAIKAAYSKSAITGALRLTNAKVTYVDGNNKYLQDESGAVDVYNVKSFNYTAGDVLNGIATVKYTLYSGGLPEITSFSAIGEITKTTGEAPAPEEMTIAEANDDANLCKYVILKKVNITAGSAGNATAKDDKDNTINVYKSKNTFVDGQYDVTGIVSYYKAKQIAFICYSPDFTIDEDADKNAITVGENGTVTLNRTFSANTWNTLVLPFAMTADQVSEAFGSDAKFANYTGTTKQSDGNYTLNFKTTTEIAANTPVFVFGATGSSFTIAGVNVVNGDAAAPSGAAFTFNGT